MGSCFSSPQNQQSHATQTPASYAAAVAQSAAHAVSDFIQDQAGNAGAPPNAHSANAQQTNPSGLQVINNAYVFKMPDGDTFTCDYTDHAGQKVTARVRIMAIDCPESNQNFGFVSFLHLRSVFINILTHTFLPTFFTTLPTRSQDARQIGEKLIFRTNVTLHVHTTDRYGRLVADVITQSGLNFGEEMLRQGAAWHYKAYDKRQNLAQLEVDAREARIGLWAFPRPQEPWEYRRRKRQAAN